MMCYTYCQNLRLFDEKEIDRNVGLKKRTKWKSCANVFAIFKIFMRNDNGLQVR